ncbi:MAG: hypothetical protein LBE13_10760 [Bacteroidales bacterium]|nr:hypothetical protein [Bacteroidales bacterium]
MSKVILKDCGCLAKEGKKKGSIKAHTMIDLSYNIPCLICYSETAGYDHVLLFEVYLDMDSYITFDK